MNERMHEWKTQIPKLLLSLLGEPLLASQGQMGFYCSFELTQSDDPWAR